MPPTLAPAIAALFALLWVLAHVWLVTIRRFAARLQRDHPAAWTSLGCPEIRFARRLPLSQWRAHRQLFAFIAGARDRALGDGELARSGDRLRGILRVYPAGFVLLVGLILASASLDPRSTTGACGTPHLRRGYDLLYRDGDVAGAIREYDEAIAEAPGSSDAYAYRGIAFERAGESGKARADYERALALDPDSKMALDRLSWLHLISQDPSAARPLLDRLIEIDPGEGRHLFNRAGLRRRDGDLDGARLDVERSCALGHSPACRIQERTRRQAAEEDAHS